MITEQFLDLLRHDGFPEPVEVQQIPNVGLGVHEHPFEVKALVIEGSIEILTNGLSKTYKAGDIFQLSFKQSHSESYGAEGVKYLASRKQ
jgi:hypothetical protein